MVTNLSSFDKLDIIAPNLPAIVVLAYMVQGELVRFASGFATGWRCVEVK